MRFPIRHQILLPMASVMLVTILGVSALSAYFSAKRTRLRTEHQLRDVARTLASASFPLNNTVLQQISELSGADFVVTDAKGNPLSSSHQELREVPDEWKVQTVDTLDLDRTVRVGTTPYFYAAVRRQPRLPGDQPKVLHIYYPKESWDQAIWQSVYPPLAAGGIALALVVMLAVAIASRTTRPIGQLRDQVDRIACGDYQPVPLPKRDDEIHDLAESISRLATMLARYEDEVRRNERLRTLGQLGGGIAHRMRNSITGCRMALDLHRRECPLQSDEESLDVAVQQLELMEKYLKRFLTLGRLHTPPESPVDLVSVVENILPLVRPAAQHVGVDLRFTPPAAPCPTILGDTDALEQLLVNLILNAVDAACESDHAHVTVAVSDNGDHVQLQVIDSGPGPAAHVQDQLFEPLVTEKPDGTGLGLAVAKEIAEQHRGTIHWKRQEEQTHFIVEIPTLK